VIAGLPAPLDLGVVDLVAGCRCLGRSLTPNEYQYVAFVVPTGTAAT
jgi:hypothetical protein